MNWTETKESLEKLEEEWHESGFGEAGKVSLREYLQYNSLGANGNILANRRYLAPIKICKEVHWDVLDEIYYMAIGYRLCICSSNSHRTKIKFTIKGFDPKNGSIVHLIHGIEYNFASQITAIKTMRKLAMESYYKTMKVAHKGDRDETQGLSRGVLQ